MSNIVLLSPLFFLADAAPWRGIGGHCLGSAEPQHLAHGSRVKKERGKRRREIRERIATMIAVKRRGEADARSVKGQKERMTIAVETREINPG